MVARRAHNPKVIGSNPIPATIENPVAIRLAGFLFFKVVSQKKPRTVRVPKLKSPMRRRRIIRIMTSKNAFFRQTYDHTYLKL